MPTPIPFSQYLSQNKGGNQPPVNPAPAPVAAPVAPKNGAIPFSQYKAQKGSIKPNPSFTGIAKTGVPNSSMSGSTPMTNTGIDTIGAVKNTAQAVVGSEIGAGQDIAAAIGGKSYMDKFQKLNASDQKDLTTLIGLRNKYASSGNTAQVDRMNKFIKGHTLVGGGNVTDMFPALNKSTEQVVGDFAGLALDAVTAGTIGGGSKAMESGVLYTGKKAAEVGAEDAGKATIKSVFMKGGDAVNTFDMYDNLIKDGDATAEQIFKDAEKGVYQPEVAKQILSNASMDFERSGFPDLGKKLLSTVDSTNLTKQGLIDAANALIDSVKGTAKGATLGARIFQGAKTGAAIGAGYGVAGGMQNNENAPDLAKSAVVGGIGGAILGSATDAAFGARPATPEDQKIQQIIAPKLDKKETQAAYDEGRVITGKKDLFGKKAPDVVLPSKDTIRATATIQKNIPGASKMNDVQLYSALDKKTDDMAKSLQGDMKKVEVKMSTLSDIRDSWATLKSSQLKDDEFADFKAGNTQFQKNFETRLNALNRDITDSSGKFKTPSKQTFDNLWDARKSFDDSVPDRVKNATDASPANLQYRKKMWLDDRAVLNNAINDTESGLGATSKKAFSEMSDMYEAKNNIIQNAKIDVKGDKAGAVGKYLGNHPVQKHIIKATVGGAAGAAIGGITGSKTAETLGGIIGAGIGASGQ